MGRRYVLCVAFALAVCTGGAEAQAPVGTPACEGTPRVAPDPGYRMLFDGTRASFARWAHAGPGRFELRGDCTLESAGGLGLLWYDDEPFDSPMTLKVEWMIPGDANSGVFVGFPAVGNDPFVAVERGYEIQIDPTDTPASTTGAIYSFQAADRARRDQALHPPGEWNTYEITVDAPRIVVRLNGVVVNRFVSMSAARQSLGRGFVGLQNHSDADRVFFRSVQVKEWGGEQPRCTGATRRTPGDAFSGARLDGCRWNRIVRYDGGGLDVSGGALHLELTGGDILGPGNTGPANLVLQRAPAGAWTIETTVRVSLRSGSQQAGLLVYRDDGNYVKLVAAAAARGRVRFRLAGEARNAVAGNAPAAVARRPRSDTYLLRVARSGSRYTGFWSLTGASWRRLGSVVNVRVAQGAYGLVALGAGRHAAPPYAAFEEFRAEKR
jgi:3-keto-disaccharide hydrolase/beta-xylosidase-like protein